MSKKTSRRDFIKQGTVASAGFLALSGTSFKRARASALQDVAVAGVGVGGKGSGDIDQAGLYGKVVAICDVDSNILERKHKNFKDAKTYADFREMFAEMGDKFDAVTVSTPDHMHTVATAMAIKAKKHVYTQKPLTRTIYEARYLGELAKKMGICSQMGNQGSTSDGLRQTAAQLRAGILGKVSEVHIWTNRPIWPQGPNRDMTIKKFADSLKNEDQEDAKEMIAEKKKAIENTLKTLNWDLWLGVAPVREYWPGLYHSFSWRGWWDFGTGALGDMACHNVNMAFKGLDLKNPISVKASSSGHDFNSFPARSVCEFEFPANDWRGPIKFVWYDSKQHVGADIMAQYGFNSCDENGGSFVIGEKGALLGNSFREKGGKEIPLLKDVECAIAPVDPKNNNPDARHKFEWFNAIWQNKPDLCWSNFPYHAGPLTETILLGNLSVWTANNADMPGEKIEWDPVNLKVTNLAKLKTPGVADLVRPIYRKGYEQI